VHKEEARQEESAPRGCCLLRRSPALLTKLMARAELALF